MTRRVAIFLFLAFYVVSATAAAQHRSARMSRRVLRGSVQVSSPLQVADYHKLDVDRRPNYREAKKVVIDFDFRPLPLISLAPPMTDADFDDFLRCWEIGHFVSITANRGPPRA